MKFRQFRRFVLMGMILPGVGLAAYGDSCPDLRIAVASNFANTAQSLASQFEASRDTRLVLSFGSTGKHYAQIRNGAPFDAFLAADASRPSLLEKEGLAVAGTRFTYAIGRLVLWSANPGTVDTDAAVLRTNSFRHLAIANPRLAPYGMAAEQALRALKLWDALSDRIVRGENIGQTLHFVASGNAEIGLVALSQVVAMNRTNEWWVVPPDLHEPIEQQAVIVRDGPVIREFWKFLQSAGARVVIQKFGYEVP